MAASWSAISASSCAACWRSCAKSTRSRSRTVASLGSAASGTSINWSGRRSSSGPRRRRSSSCCSANKSGCSNAASSLRPTARRASRSRAAACARCSSSGIVACSSSRIISRCSGSGRCGLCSPAIPARAASLSALVRSRNGSPSVSNSDMGLPNIRSRSSSARRAVRANAADCWSCASNRFSCRSSGRSGASPKSCSGNISRWSPITRSGACPRSSPSPNNSPCAGPVSAPALRLFVKASTRNWIVAPAPPPYSADSPVPSMMARSGLYPRSARFCTISAVTSCAASPPPVIAAFWMRCPIVSTVSGPRSLINCPITGMSTERMKRPRGATSRRPTGEACRIARLRSS